MLVKNFMLKFCFVFLSLLPISLSAQFSEQDCLGAIPLCGNAIIDYHEGVEFPDFIPPLSTAGCLNSEVNSVWIYIQADQTSPPGATLSMIISPKNGLAADYDWAVFGPGASCGNLGIPIRCSAAPADCFYCPNTGFVGGQGFPLNSEDKATGDGYLPLFGTFPGEGYYILVNNYNNDPGGFSITFGGATILDCTPTPPCQMQLFASNDVTVCQGEAGTFDFVTTELGGGGLVDWKWTSDPPIAVNWLSDKNSANTSVTIPSFFSGIITYTITGTIPICSASKDIKVTVIPAPVVTLEPIPTQICSTADPIQLNFSPPGGYFEGFGPIFNGFLDPNEWGPGDFTLTYKVKYPSGCIGDDIIDVNIVQGPEATIEYVDEFCINDPIYKLLAVEPGGKWSGPGVNSNGEVDPKKLGVGNFKAIYTVDNGFCKSKDETTIQIKPLPVVNITDPGPICNDQLIQTLAAAPLKGKWSGLPDTLGKFKPNLLAPGNYKAYYNYTDLFGCKNADTLDIKINAKPFAIVSPTAQVCNSNTNGNTSILDFETLVSAGDLSGTWTDVSGSGATGIFPNLDFINSTPGKYTFTYTTKSAQIPCQESSYNVEVEVIDCKCPALFLTSNVVLCDDNPNFDLDNLKLNPNLGTWSILSTPVGSNPGTLLGSNFNVLNKDGGIYTVEFTLNNTPPVGCPNSNTSTVEVNSSPKAIFSPTKTVCNQLVTGNSPVTLDLSSYIISGDKGGTWIEVTSSGAAGSLPILDFTGVAPGNYTFKYTTNSAKAPCVENSYTVDVFVQDCECPNLDLLQNLELCNSLSTYDLNLQKVTTEAGNWTIKSKPTGSNPITLTGSNMNILGKDAGQYIFSFTLSQTPPPGCPVSNDVTVNIFDEPKIILTQNVDVCNSNLSGNSTIVNLENLITSGSKNGTWSDINGSGAIGPDNAKDFDGIAPGNYVFSFKTNTANFPCLDKTYSVTITVNDCKCPSLSVIKYTALCTVGTTSIDLNNLKITSEQGFWSLKTKPAGSKPATLVGTTFNALNADGGIYVLSFNLQSSPPVGCPSSADITIEVVPAPAATLNGSVNVCNSTGSGQYLTTIDLYTQIINGDNQGTFADTDNSGAKLNGKTLDFTGVTPGSYTFTYTTKSAKSPCSESVYSIEVIVEDCDCPSVATKNPGNLCSDNANINLSTLAITNEPGTWTITTQPSGPNPASIISNTFNGTNSNPGTYVLTYTLNTTPPNGCSISSKQTFKIVQNLTAGITPNEISLCQNQSQLINLNGQLSGSSPGGVWKEVSVIPSKNNVQNILNGLFNTQNQAPGTYLVEYTVSPESPCQESSVILKININPNPIADAGPDKTITCSSPIVDLGGLNSSVGAEFIYNWSGSVGSNSSLITNTSVPGTYQLIITNTITSCTASDNVVVELANDLPLPSNLEIDSINCFGNSNAKIKFDKIVGGTAPYTVYLNGVDFGKAQYFTKLPPGNYNLKIVDINGCSSQQDINITEPDEVYLELGDDITITLGDSTQIEPFINIPLNEIDTIIWSPLINGINGACAGCFEPIIFPYYTTPLEMLVIDKNGCRVSDKILVTVDVIRQVYFPNIFSPNEDALNDRFYPFADNLVTSIVEFKIFNRWGDMVFEQYNFNPNDYDKGWDGTRNGKLLNSGVYVYYAIIEFRDGAKKIFKGDVTLKR